jgi:hypothetical protein
MQNSFNNYQENATDTLGQTIKNKQFTLPQNLTDAHLVLITSNHGANSGGEEYNRRWHYVYLNQEEILNYKPGRTSCEPFRKYNTQANGIYTTRPRTDEQWQSFSNWCPGDVIDTRVIPLGALPAGEHLFTIEVPDAVFPDKNGNFPLSLYFQGKTEGTLVGLETPEPLRGDVFLYPNPIESHFLVQAPVPVTKITVQNLTGQPVLQERTNSTVAFNRFAPGIYFVSVELENGNKSIHKVVKK